MWLVHLYKNRAHCSLMNHYSLMHCILQVLQLEALLGSESYSCVRKVCLHKGMRFLVGDEWKASQGRVCSCLHVRIWVMGTMMGHGKCIVRMTVYLFLHQDGSIDCS